jgi:EAL domain-containing protein (putative c-di-GMP-specific phosphodiesterase class I)/GGDEF domain-containing protein
VAGPPALLVRFTAGGGVGATNLTDRDGAPDTRWGRGDVEELAARWSGFGPAVLDDGEDRTWVWERDGRSLVTTAARVVDVGDDGVVGVFVATATLDVTDLRAGRSDPDTGLAGRDVVVDRLAAVIRGLRHHPAPVGVAVVALGHHVAAAELSTAAEALEQTIRGGDLAGRVGPGELAVVFGTAISETEARVVAARILDVLAGHPDVHVGMAFTGTPVAAGALLDEAEAAVDLARGTGTRTYVVDDEDRGRLEWTTRRVDELRVAVDHDHFEVRYQPVVRLADGSVRSYEALVRWAHPTDGEIGPDEFVPLAERTGLIDGVTDRVLGHVLDDLAGASGSVPAVAVNVSATDLLRPGFAAGLVGRLAARGVRAGSLSLELTERAVLADVDRAVDVLGALREGGVAVALDDFGTGASTLSVLSHLPVECLKIDRSFVEGLPASEGGRAVVRLVLGLARELGIAVVAEGIERDEQVACLVELGCEWGQGYLFGPARTGAELAAPGAWRPAAG